MRNLIMTDENQIDNTVPNFYRASAIDFKKIPGSPIAYLINNKVREIYAQYPPLGNIIDVRVGLMTSDNDRFIRYCWEVSLDSTCFNASNSKEAENSRKRWFPHEQGRSSGGRDGKTEL